jgi:catechol 2,3-dioxygenase-like lactoylglutathione lyase family enzyme
MGLVRIDNIDVIVEDLDAAIAFYAELGMTLEGRTTVEGAVVDRLVGLEGVRSEIAMMRAPNGVGLELTKFHRPAAVGFDPQSAPVNSRGMGRVMFTVDDISGTVARLEGLGAKLIGEIVQYEDAYRLCYLRGPEGIPVALAEDLRHN